MDLFCRLFSWQTLCLLQPRVHIYLIRLIKGEAPRRTINLPRAILVLQIRIIFNTHPPPRHSESFVFCFN